MTRRLRTAGTPSFVLCWVLATAGQAGAQVPASDTADGPTVPQADGNTAPGNMDSLSAQGAIEQGAAEPNARRRLETNPPTEETVGTMIEGVAVAEPASEPVPQPRPLLRPRLGASIGLATIITTFEEGPTGTGVGLTLGVFAGLQVTDYAAVIAEANMLGGLDTDANQLYGFGSAFLLEGTFGYLQIAGGVGVGFLATLPTAAVNRVDSPLPPLGGPGRAVSYHLRVGLTTGSRTRFDRKGFAVSLRYEQLSAPSRVHVLGLSFGVQRF